MASPRRSFHLVTLPGPRLIAIGAGVSHLLEDRSSWIYRHFLFLMEMSYAGMKISVAEPVGCPNVQCFSKAPGPPGCSGKVQSCLGECRLKDGCWKDTCRWRCGGSCRWTGGSRVGRVDERVVGDWVGVGEVDRHASVT